MRLGALLLLLGLSATATPLSAAEETDPFTKGNAALARKDHAGAVALYQTALEKNWSAAGLFNLGLAQEALGRHGPAILAFERAALLAPRHPTILTGLKQAREASRAATPEAGMESSPSLSWPEAAATRLSLHEWSWITGTGLVTATVILVLRLLAGPLRARPWMRPVSIGLFITSLAAASAGASALAARRGERQLAILTDAQPELKLSPFADAAPVPGTASAAGTRVRLEQMIRQDWQYVTLPGTGLSGWVPLKSLAPLFPPARPQGSGYFPG